MSKVVGLNSLQLTSSFSYFLYVTQKLKKKIKITLLFNRLVLVKTIAFVKMLLKDCQGWIGEDDSSIIWGLSSVGRTIVLQTIGHEFDSRSFHQKVLKVLLKKYW